MNELEKYIVYADDLVSAATLAFEKLGMTHLLAGMNLKEMARQFSRRKPWLILSKKERNRKHYDRMMRKRRKK